MATGVGVGHTECYDSYKGRLKTTRDAVVDIGLAEHHKSGFLWKLGKAEDTKSAMMLQG